MLMVLMLMMNPLPRMSIRRRATRKMTHDGRRHALVIALTAGFDEHGVGGRWGSAGGGVRIGEGGDSSVFDQGADDFFFGDFAKVAAVDEVVFGAFVAVVTVVAVDGGGVAVVAVGGGVVDGCFGVVGGGVNGASVAIAGTSAVAGALASVFLVVDWRSRWVDGRRSDRFLSVVVIAREVMFVVDVGHVDVVGSHQGLNSVR